MEKTVTEIREKRRNELLSKWLEKTRFDNPNHLRDHVNLHEGNFVDHYFTNEDYEDLMHSNVDTIQYHIRMLEYTRVFLERILQNYNAMSVDEKYSANRVYNAIVLLENIRAETLYKIFEKKLSSLENAKTKKEMEWLDARLNEFVIRYYNKDGYVRPYIKDK